MPSQKYYALFFILLGLILFGINVFGIFLPIAPQNLSQENLRFPNDQALTFEQALDRLEWLNMDDITTFSSRVNDSIAKRLAHLHWQKYPPERFNQRIPIWENYILFLMGKLTTIPEYKRYHFANPYRSLERGIGICGDASMIMSQVLDKQNIQNKIISFPGHVIVAVKNTSDQTWLYDPDFNVIVPHSVEEVNAYPLLVKPFYREKGYSEKEIQSLVNSYSMEYKVWNGASHFITKKYYFEYFSYFLKWALPIIFFTISACLLRYILINNHSIH